MFVASKVKLTRDAIRWGEKKGRWTKIIDGVYGEGNARPTPVDRAVAILLLSGGVACGSFAGYLHELVGVQFRGAEFITPPGRSHKRPGARRRVLPTERITLVKGLAARTVFRRCST